jgi:hypothetical protein
MRKKLEEKIIQEYEKVKGSTKEVTESIVEESNE